MEKQTQRMAPTNIAKGMSLELVDLSKRLSESIAEGKAAMEEREREIRSEVENESEPGQKAKSDGTGR